MAHDVGATTRHGVGVLAAMVCLGMAAHPATGQNETFVHLAGNPGGPGWFDGTGSAARFNIPYGVAVDGSGFVYVGDSNNHTIRRISPGGAVTTLAGLAESAGSVDGTGSAARFYQPQGVALDGSGNVYVADTRNHTVRKISPGGVVTTLAGLAGSPGTADGPGSAARFNEPRNIAVDGSGNVLVADANNHTIRKITPAGVVTTLAGLAGSYGTADGTGSAARFQYPTGVAFDPSGNVFVTDRANQTIRKISPAGVVTTLAGLAGSPGTADGTGSAARFHFPTGVAIDGSGNLFVTDYASRTIRKITPAGVVTTLAGLAGHLGNLDGTGSAARFYGPAGIALDLSGAAYVADSLNHTIRKITPGGVVTTIAGVAGSDPSTDGTGSAARFDNPHGVAVDGSGVVYVADASNCTVRKVSPGGVVTTFAGLAKNSGTADGTGSAARFRQPVGVAVAASGTVYVTDAASHTIRKITPAGVVTTLAGLGGSPGSADGTGSAARFRSPWHVAVDGSGNVYVADSGNDTIRKITPAGVVTTLAGLAGSPGTADGTGSAARFDSPRGVATDGSGNVFVADTLNHTIRKITPAGVVTTLAGLPGTYGHADGTGSAARFNLPDDIATDGSGNLYATDDDTIRKITPAGVVTTLAGLGGVSGSADGTGSAARFNGPTGIAVDGSGHLYVAESTNHAIRVSVPTLPDLATIDSPAGIVGAVRLLDTAPRTAMTWSWQVVRQETGSTAALSSTSARNPTFTPDASGYFVFQVTATGYAGTSVSTVALSAGTTTCVEDATTMCLIGGRYRVTSHWQNQYAGGAIATLKKTRLSDATGGFWLSDSGSFEYLIRILTATPNRRAWIAIPTFTDVEFWITVEDTVNGQSYTYHSPAGNRTLLYDPYFFVYPVRLEPVGPEAIRAGGPDELVTSSVTSGNCAEDSTTMCLNGGRYRVTSYWKNQYAGGAIATLNKSRITDSMGGFWLSDGSSLEFLIRISTGTPNGKAWIAIPTFTDVEFWITVQDTVRSQTFTYHSPAGNRTLIYDPDFFLYP